MIWIDTLINLFSRLIRRPSPAVPPVVVVNALTFTQLPAVKCQQGHEFPVGTTASELSSSLGKIAKELRNFSRLKLLSLALDLDYDRELEGVESVGELELRILPHLKLATLKLVRQYQRSIHHKLQEQLHRRVENE
jgi:hypothetical protein